MAVVDWLSKSSKATKALSSLWSSVLSAGAVVAGSALATSGFKNNPIDIPMILLGIVCLVAGWTVIYYSKKLETHAKDKAKSDVKSARRQAVVTYNNKVSHVFADLDKVVDPVTRQDHLEAFKRSVLVSSTSLFQLEGVRTCLYILDGSVIEGGTGKPSVLVHVPPQYGRSDQPRKSFEENTAHGRLLFRVMSDRRPLCIGDVDQSDEPIDSKGKEYKSFIAVPICSGNDELGVLTIDALKAGDLDRDHLPTAVMLASLMAIGLKAPAVALEAPIRAERRRG